MDRYDILERLDNTYWTRLICVSQYHHDVGELAAQIEDRKFPLGPDVVEECQAVVDLQQQDNNEQEWSPLFEPNDFNQNNGPLLIKEYQLSNEDL